MKNNLQTKNFDNKTFNASAKQIFGFCSNIFLFAMSIVGIIFLFTVPLNRGSKTTVANWTTFKFFTTDSNILITIASLIYCVYYLLIWSNKFQKIPTWVYVFKHTSTLCVGLTMIITLFVLLPGAIITELYPASSLYLGSNLFHHLLCPLLAIITFLLFENETNINFKHTFWSLIPLIIYCVFYMIMAYTHINPDGSFQKGYDWYYFCSFGIGPTIGILIFLIGFYYLFAWLFWKWNRKINIKYFKNNQKVS